MLVTMGFPLQSMASASKSDALLKIRPAFEPRVAASLGSLAAVSKCFWRHRLSLAAQSAKPVLKCKRPVL